jgi:hypothetical protein
MFFRGITLVMFALFIDGLQAVLGWVFLTLGAGIPIGAPIAGSIAGASVGCVVGGVGAGIITVITGGAAFPSLFAVGAACAAAGAGGALIGGTAGTAIGAAGIPLGIGLSIAAEVCISITLGTGFILLLLVFRMFYPTYVWAVFIGEAMPGLDVIPGWTLLAIRSILKKNAESPNGIVSLASGIASSVLSPSMRPSSLGNVARSISMVKGQTRSLIHTSAQRQEPYNELGSVNENREQLAAETRSSISAMTDIVPRGHTPHAKAA